MNSPSDLPAFEEFFHQATGQQPYPYQIAVAGRGFANCVISVPTGCGKTAAVVLWWLYQSQQEDDRKHPPLELRLTAKKQLLPAPDSCRLPNGLASFVAKQHSLGTQTLVVVNRVERAREVFEALKKNFRAGASPVLLLAHSQFRPHERQRLGEQLTVSPSDAGRIIVATQVVEAGVDITSALLVTDLAPWASMVQRFGRCNRSGEFASATVYDTACCSLRSEDCLFN